MPEAVARPSALEVAILNAMRSSSAASEARDVDAHARVWWGAQQELRRIVDTPAPPWAWLRARRERGVRRRCSDAQVSAAHALTTLSAGCDPAEWGVLSGVGYNRGSSHDGDRRQGVLRLEHVAEIALRDPSVPNRRVWSSLRSVAPHARALRVLRLPEATAVVGAMEEAMQQLVADEPTGEDLREQLRLLLPLRCRPAVARWQDLERPSHAPVWMLLTDGSERDSPVDIWLAELVVAPVHRGMGLGAASLGELCRIADRDGLTIGCMMTIGPGIRDPAEAGPAVRALARFYSRFGFHGATGEAPERWSDRAYLRRKPIT